MVRNRDKNLKHHLPATPSQAQLQSFIPGSSIPTKVAWGVVVSPYQLLSAAPSSSHCSPAPTWTLPRLQFQNKPINQQKKKKKIRGRGAKKFRGVWNLFRSGASNRLQNEVLQVIGQWEAAGNLWRKQAWVVCREEKTLGIGHRSIRRL